MYRRKRDILSKWLEIEYHSVAYKIGLNRECKSVVNKELIYETIRCLDYETVVNEVVDKNYVITIIGLMWEHCNKEEYDLKSFIIKILSRIGYPTSAVICDKDFDYETGTFSHMSSFIDEVTTTINQMKNEVKIKEKELLLTDFQKDIWDSMDKDRILGISAPTSAGKSFVLLMKLISKILYRNIDIVYIVPTLSLVNQVTEDFNKQLKEIQFKDYAILNSYNNKQDVEIRNIYILTQEKAIAAFSEFERVFTKRLILVVDEIQNIERINDEDDDRSRILFDALTEFRDKQNIEQIIISGPRIKNIENVARKLFDGDVKEHCSIISPVLNLTYSIEKKRGKYYFKQYCNITDAPICEVIDNPSIIEGYGQKKYTDKYLRYLSGVINKLGNGTQNIIFAPTTKNAKKIALGLDNKGKLLDESLIEYYQNTVRENYALCNALRNGNAYHHGKLPMHVRRTLEKAIADKLIYNVVCTTTLLQGVNLPAQNVFIRNPHLYELKKSEKKELTNYEMANLRGRAGRLLKDYIGRIFVMDENEFVDSDGFDGEELFTDVTKELPTSYEAKYEEYKEKIKDALEGESKVSDIAKEYGYLITYIRQVILKNGNSKAKIKLNKVGIVLSHKEINKISKTLKGIAVSTEVCFKNRYWDPLVLDKIYKEYNGKIPTGPFEKKIKDNISNMLRFLRDTKETAYMYNKHIPDKYRKGQMRGILVDTCVKWLQGKKLKEILNNKRYDGDRGEDMIDETIELLQNTVSYHIPLLLKPLYDMFEPNSILLNCIQVGAYSVISRKMIEMGIPRETALYLEEIIMEHELSIEENEDIDVKIKEVLMKIYDKLPKWLKVQVDYLL